MDIVCHARKELTFRQLFVVIITCIQKRKVRDVTNIFRPYVYGKISDRSVPVWECGKCESHCPQHLAIRQKLKEADGKLLPFYYKIGLKVVKKLGLFW